MNKDSFMTKLSDLCENVTSKLGYELVDVEYIREKNNYFLRVYIHKPNGVNLDDCQIVSKELGIRLDEEDIIKRAYYLEVSSPGLDRPLKTEKDLKRNIGKDVEVSLYKQIDGVKKYEGILISYDSSSINLQILDKVVNIPKKAISLIKLTIKF